jgi:ABC-type sugar transport system substrate-binding protein
LTNTDKQRIDHRAVKIEKDGYMGNLDNKLAAITARRNFIKTAGIVAGATLLPSSFIDLQTKGKETFQNAGPSQAQRALKIVMVPKFTGAAYFAATEKGAKEAVVELKEKDVAIDFLYTGPAAANSDEQVRMIDDLLAQNPDAIIIAPTTMRSSLTLWV